MSQSDDIVSPTDFSAAEVELLREVIRSLHGLRYGTVVLNVHDGRVVEIQRTEKIRRKISREPAADTSAR